jgi:diguanylate cyclase (GGDEF)-like protein
MKELSFPTKIYLGSMYISGIIVMAWQVNQYEYKIPWMLFLLCGLASIGLILKVEGATSRSHYTFSFLVYGLTFALYGTSNAIFVIAVSNLVEWFWHRPPWFIQLFNCTCYIVLMQIVGIVNQWINPEQSLLSGQAVLALAASLAAFDLLNHLAVGIVLWLARSETFKKSGVFDLFPLMLDLGLLYFGASLAFIWKYNNVAVILSLIPIYVIYRTLRIPALERQTKLDSKTGLFNDDYFRQQFQNELNRANRFDRPLAIIMADLDLLRNINNAYGHLAGDEVLIGVARVLKQSMREYDIVSRFGGEEFAILLPETSLKDAYAKAEKIRKTIENTGFVVRTDLTSVRATMSFGVACREHQNQTQDEIINHADAALYQSKISGRNRVYIYTGDSCINFVRSLENTNETGSSIIGVSYSDA